MKFDSEQVICHSALGHKPNSRSFEYHDNAVDSSAFKSGVKENQNGVLSNIRSTGEDAAQLSYEMNVGDDLTNNNKKVVRDFVVPYTPSRKMEYFVKDSVFYMDKSIMEREPELIVCYKENTCHVVKDICVDEGVPSPEKLLFESDIDKKGVHPFLVAERNQNNEMIKEKADIDAHIPEVSKSLAVKDSDNNTVNQCDSKGMMEVNDDRRDTNATNASKGIISLGELLSMQEFSTELLNPKSSNFDSNEVKQQSVYPEHPHPKFLNDDGNEIERRLVHAGNCISKSLNYDINEVKKQSVQSSFEKAISVSPLVSAPEESDRRREEANLVNPPVGSSADKSDYSSGEADMVSTALASASEESNNGSLGNELSYNSKVETGSILFNFDPSTATTGGSGRVECSQTVEREHPETQSSRLEDPNSGPLPNLLQHGHGESSFSATGPLSGLISYSGPIAYSGSLSLRSDSSTTSTRSFAFPILQSEWNSSPVRMAKADRRHFRKHRSWRQGLLCCRF